MSEAPFTRVGVRPIPPPRLKTRPWYEGRPVLSCAVLAVILLGCLFCEAFIPKDPAYMDLYHASTPPGGGFWLGTDAMGRPRWFPRCWPFSSARPAVCRPGGWTGC